MRQLMTTALLGTVLSVAAAIPVFAQTASAPGADPAQARAPRGQEPHRSIMPSERVEARLAYIKTALKITPAQGPQWDAFANVVRKQAAERDKRVQEWRSRVAARDSAERRPPTVIERMDRAQQFLTAANARLSELSTVVKPLYAVLTDEQKQIADTMLAQRERERMHHRGGHGGFGV
jgi:Spy/CpxP family protein refolding chaperone